MLTTINPATGEKLSDYKEMDATEVEGCIAAASACQTIWATSRLADRTRLLSDIADAFEAHAEEGARLMTLEMGKTYASARAEMKKSASAFRYYAKDGPTLLEPRIYRHSQGKPSRGEWHPLGVILAVMPWNFPVWQVVRALAPAIMAGNTLLLKHASNVQGTAAFLEDMVRKAGAPEGLFTNLPVKSDRVAAIIDDPRIAAVTLTGSEGAGSAVAERAGRNLKKLVLELGGSDPFIVMPSADMDNAVRQAVAARIQNTGQSCICAKRMIVHADVYDEFERRFAEALSQVKVGDPMEEASDMGPLSSMEQRETVMGQLAAIGKSGGTLHGGEIPDGPGAYIAAGHVTGLDPFCAAAMEEIFGPIALLFKASDTDAIVKIANATPFGLGATVCTQSEEDRRIFADGIASGMLSFNAQLASDPAVPFGGIKRSGHGREMADSGLHEFMNLKIIIG